MANNILEIKKRKLESHYQQGLEKAVKAVKEEDYEYIDSKTWTWARVIFFILAIAIVAGALAWKESHACFGTEEEPMEPIEVMGI